ncbi:multidrug resistance protein, MATE family [Flavobacterium glycines]|uniref:Multidrug-efflux transporter n=1 Tax=Flavobacterium glycines TaxID=551990 RepID=A0A1B9DWM8_9FLAO|nr:MATE family efflux transporter [Flavobacterium glycines]OCB74093.1 MATE family efflux transporter [Flavobacterium glycines]GEL09509.1 MATE family efflux transporter [Flavobacterium glycines]SDJ04201.1 multidrug resistance protein, MATE family [Flavobacterium glycines]
MTLAIYTKEFAYNFRLAYPIILGMLGHTVVGLVDNVMVGKLGPTELAAVSLANSFIFIAMSLGIGFSTAITPLAAEADGEQDIEKGRRVFHHGLYLCTFLGFFLFALVIFAKQLLGFMGQPENVVILAKPYLDMVAFSLIPLIVFQGYKQFADGMSETKYSMWATVLANIIHVILNYVFIYGIWIFPELGMFGAAIGTLASRFIMLGYIHYKMKKNVKFHPFFEGFSVKKIQREINLKIIRLGAPSSMQMFFEVALFTGAVWLSGRLGIANQAANQIALSLASFTFMFAMGLSVAATIRVGNQKGLGDYKKMKIVAFSIFLLAVLLEVFFALFFVLFHKQMPALFVDMGNLKDLVANTEVITIAAQLLLVAAVFQISDGIQAVVLGALRGLQDAKVPMYITFVAYWMVGFPVSVYLGFYTSLQAIGIWIGLLAGLTTAALFLYIRFIRLTKQLIALNH